MKGTEGRPKVLAQVGDASGCTLWRIWNPFKNLKLAGYPATWGWLNFKDAAEVTALVDLVVLGRAGWSPGQEQVAIRWRDRIRVDRVACLADWDDDMFSPEFVPRQWETSVEAIPDLTPEVLEEHRLARIWSLGVFDGHTVSTPTLAEVLARFTDRPIRVVPNAIDAEWWEAVQSQYGDPIPHRVIGWIGGNRPDRDGQLVAEAWRRVARRHPDVRFLIMGHAMPSLMEAVDEDQRIFIPWMPLEAYPFPYAMVDIGCCPLADELFNRSKSPIKAFEFGLSGAAVLASPTVYGGVLRDGETGFICDGPDAWEARIEQLLADEEQRRALAARWKAEVLARHSIAACLDNWPRAWAELYAPVTFGPWRALDGLEALGA